MKITLEIDGFLKTKLIRLLELEGIEVEHPESHVLMLLEEAIDEALMILPEEDEDFLDLLFA